MSELNQSIPSGSYQDYTGSRKFLLLWQGSFRGTTRGYTCLAGMLDIVDLPPNPLAAPGRLVRECSWQKTEAHVSHGQNSFCEAKSGLQCKPIYSSSSYEPGQRISGQPKGHGPLESTLMRTTAVPSSILTAAHIPPLKGANRLGNAAKPPRSLPGPLPWKQRHSLQSSSGLRDPLRSGVRDRSEGSRILLALESPLHT